MTCRLCLPPASWPEFDRARWSAAQAPAGFLEGDKPASHWSPAQRQIIEQGYGQWLGFLARTGALDPACAPGARASEDRLRAFVAALQARVAPATVGMMVGALVRMLRVLEPDMDWRWLSRVYSSLKRTATPSRDKLARMVAATDLFELGVRLMETCHGPAQRVYKATRYRDGLLIALLIACPMRLRNLTGIVIGRHLVFHREDYRIELTAAETKTGRPYHAAVPPALTPYIGRWLRVHRRNLQLTANPDHATRDAGGRLWLDRWGRPMSSGAIRDQIEARTRQAFGKAIWPHLFRDCAVSELVDSAPEEIGIAPDLLGHTGLQTTKKHYIQATGMTAHARIQEMIAARRRAATLRDIRDG